LFAKSALISLFSFNIFSSKLVPKSLNSISKKTPTLHQAKPNFAGRGRSSQQK